MKALPWACLPLLVLVLAGYVIVISVAKARLYRTASGGPRGT
jgi:hypothetical protein